MKTVFTLLLATIISTAAFAYDEGRLSITVAVQKDAVVYVDGRSYQPDDNSIVIDNIRSGNHTIKVYRKMNNRNNNGRNNNRNNQREELLYSSTVFVRPSYHVDVVVNRFGKALVDEKAMNNRDNDWDRDDNWGRDRDRDNNNSYNRAMSDYDFNALHQKIKGAWFGSSKMNMAKDAFSRNNYFSTTQVRQILQLFNSESDKLELAKLAYRNTVDQRSYFQLYDVFSFQSSKDELDRYIRDFRY